MWREERESTRARARENDSIPAEELAVVAGVLRRVITMICLSVRCSNREKQIVGKKSVSMSVSV
jgi:hypothetical protein